MSSPLALYTDCTSSNYIVDHGTKETFYHEFLNSLYDAYSSKILGFILRQSFSSIEGERLLINVFVNAWESISWLSENKENNFKDLLRITGNIIKKERPEFNSISYNPL